MQRQRGAGRACGLEEPAAPTQGGARRMQRAPVVDAAVDRPPPATELRGVGACRARNQAPQAPHQRDVGTGNGRERGHRGKFPMSAARPNEMRCQPRAQTKCAANGENGLQGRTPTELKGNSTGPETRCQLRAQNTPSAPRQGGRCWSQYAAARGLRGSRNQRPQGKGEGGGGGAGGGNERATAPNARSTPVIGPAGTTKAPAGRGAAGP